MSDVRLVRLNEINLAEYGGLMEEIKDDPNGTHLLVPLEKLRPSFSDGEGMILDFVALCCPTCGGNQVVPHPDCAEIGPVLVMCHDCNGRGWVVGDALILTQSTEK